MRDKTSGESHNRSSRQHALNHMTLGRGDDTTAKSVFNRSLCSLQTQVLIQCSRCLAGDKVQSPTKVYSLSTFLKNEGKKSANQEFFK